MIRPELKKELESIARRMDEHDPAERAIGSVLFAALSAIETGNEVPLMQHVAIFSQRLVNALAKVLARRN